MQTAFAQPERTMTARITIDGVIYGPEHIQEIKLNRGVSLADQFEIGTSYAQIVTFSLLDEEGTLLENKDLTGKRAKVEIGIEVAGSITYKDMGSYILETPEKVQRTKWSIEGTDDMIKGDIIFQDKLEYPQTIGAIYSHAVAQMGMTTDTSTFLNSDKIVDVKPQYYDMTIREALADIAELAGGYCFVEEGKVRIRSIVQDTTTKVTSDNTVDFRRNDGEGIVIDQIIIRQQGAVDHVFGVGTHPYFLNDNVFIQGNPEDFSQGLYTALNGFNFTPCEVDFNGNPTEVLNGWVNLEYLGEIYRVFPTSREITFSGGMREKWTSKFLDNLPHEEYVSDIVRTIKKTNAQMLVLDDRISLKVEETVGEIAQIYQVEIISTGGTYFRNGQIFTTLLARVYKGDEDVTDQIDANQFRWTKYNEDGSLDTVWNSANASGMKQVNITAADVFRKASFLCEILKG